MRCFEGFQKGVNLGGWISQFAKYDHEHFRTFITREDSAYIASLGFDHVRLPVDYNVLEDEQGGYDAQQDKKDGAREAIEVEFGNMYAREVASFSNSILTGAPVEVPAEEAVQVQRVMEAAYRSNDEARTIKLQKE